MTMSMSAFSRFSLALTGSTLLAAGTAAGASAEELVPGHTGSSDVWGCFVGVSGGASDDNPFLVGHESVFVLSALDEEGTVSVDRIEVRGSNDDGTIADAPIDFTVTGDTLTLAGEDIADAVFAAGGQDLPQRLTVDVLVDGELEASHVLEHHAGKVNSTTHEAAFRGCSDDVASGTVRDAWVYSLGGAPAEVARAEEGVEVVHGPEHGELTVEDVEQPDGSRSSQFVYTPEPGFTGVEKMTFEYVNENGDLVRKVEVVEAFAASDVSVGVPTDRFEVTGTAPDGSPLPEGFRWITVPAEERAGGDLPAEREDPAEDAPAEEGAPADDAGEHEVPEKVETGAAPSSPWLLGAGALGAAGVAGAAMRWVTRTR